jgi:hypothetical protein
VNGNDQEKTLGGRRTRGLPPLNEAIDLSPGAWIARMDQDNIFFPGSFGGQVTYLAQSALIEETKW